ncbi:MAG: ABC transporter ATP-binding protein [Synergistaceae bacterium]
MIEIENLTVKYSAKDPNVIDGITLSVGRGEKIALLGDNGAGKTTLLLTIVGILPISGGTIRVNEIEVNKKNIDSVRRSVGFVFQNPDDQLFMPTVAQDIAFGMKNYGASEAEIAEKRRNIMEALGISDLENAMVHKLSGGEKRLAAMAGILVMSPDAILLDEPTSFLDMKARNRLIAHLNALTQSMVIATHDMDFAKRTCTRAIFLSGGKVYADCSMESLYENKELLAEFGFGS